ncbi:MAG: CAP domain-containing protein [Verrucomicrobiales bacterium]|nr:CAP domain-containing protein [Verrucomicrobiales bacterium]
MAGVLLSLSAAAHADDDAVFFQQTLTLINQQRAKANARPVTLDDKLMKISGEWAVKKAEAGDLIHRKEFTVLLNQLRYSYLNENIYFYSEKPTADRVITAWMNSAGHRRNLLQDRVDRIGLGRARGGDGYYVVFNGADSRPPERSDHAPARANSPRMKPNSLLALTVSTLLAARRTLRR